MAWKKDPAKSDEDSQSNLSYNHHLARVLVQLWIVLTYTSDIPQLSGCKFARLLLISADLVSCLDWSTIHSSISQSFTLPALVALRKGLAASWVAIYEAHNSTIRRAKHQEVHECPEWSTTVITVHHSQNMEQYGAVEYQRAAQAPCGAFIHALDEVSHAHLSTLGGQCGPSSDFKPSRPRSVKHTVYICI